MDPEKALIAKVEGQIREVMADIHAMMAPDSGVPLSRAMRLMQVYVEPMRTVLAELRGPDLEHRTGGMMLYPGGAGGAGNPMTELMEMFKPMAETAKQQGLASAYRAAVDAEDPVLAERIREKLAEAAGVGDDLPPRTVGVEPIEPVGMSLEDSMASGLRNTLTEPPGCPGNESPDGNCRLCANCARCEYCEYHRSTCPLAPFPMKDLS